ncbi:FAD/NAD(P)-binding domain-containing protein [Ramaria rubella]|nr:FAD/NAD(P)-binding domain-containing protein [Ramaria rubella]
MLWAVAWHVRRADKAAGEPCGNLEWGTSVGLHRAQFLDLIAKLLLETRRAKSHFGKRCVGFTQLEDLHEGGDALDDPVTLHFSDGTSATCDVLIGCDGIKSAIRGELLHEAFGAPQNTEAEQDKTRRLAATKFSGTVVYRGLIKLDDLKGVSSDLDAMKTATTYCGKNKHVVAYPVGGGRFVNFLAYTSEPGKRAEWASQPWEVQVDAEEVRELFKDFEPKVQALLKCIDKSSRWAMYDVEPLDFWSKGNVTLLGDAAHAMMPFLGAGCGQGLEDVYVLSRLLGSPLATRRTLPSVLLAYERVRMSKANRVILCTREAKCAFEFLQEYDGSMNEEVVQTIIRLSYWLKEDKGEPADDFHAAESILRELANNES